MLFFGKKKHKEEEDDFLDGEKAPPKKIKDLYPQNRRKRVEPIKPWGKKERYLILFVFLFSAISSGVLGASARSWKLPGGPTFSKPEISFDKTIVVENPKRSNNRNYSELKGDIETITKPLSGVYAVYFFDIDQNSGFGINDTTSMQAASLIKLPVMAAFYQEVQEGNIDMETKYVLKDSDKISGSGSLFGRPAGTVFTYKELVTLMGKQSDNTAFNVLRHVLGDELIQKKILSIGMNNTSISENQTTAFDVGLFFKKLNGGELLSKYYQKMLLDSITHTVYEEWIPASIPAGVEVAHKYGREIHVINDAGIVFDGKPYVLVILTQGIVEKETTEVFPKIVQLINESHKEFHSL